MNPLRAASAWYWIAGTFVAFVGVALVRLLAPQLVDPARTWTAVAGQLLGVAGLFVIAMGVRRRLHATPPVRFLAPGADPIAPRNPTP